MGTTSAGLGDAPKLGGVRRQNLTGTGQRCGHGGKLAKRYKGLRSVSVRNRAFGRGRRAQPSEPGSGRLQESVGKSKGSQEPPGK